MKWASILKRRWRAVVSLLAIGACPGLAAHEIPDDVTVQLLVVPQAQQELRACAGLIGQGAGFQATPVQGGQVVPVLGHEEVLLEHFECGGGIRIGLESRELLSDAGVHVGFPGALCSARLAGEGVACTPRASRAGRPHGLHRRCARGA